MILTCQTLKMVLMKVGINKEVNMINMVDIITDNRSYTISELYEKIKSGEIVLDGDINVDENSKCMLIDSIMSHIPVPRIYAFRKNDKIVVVNSKPIAVIWAYMNDEFLLKSQLIDFPNTTFSSLKPQFQRRFKEKVIDFNILRVNYANQEEYVKDFISMYQNLN